MSRLLIVIFIIGSQLMLVSCASHRVALTPLTETERQELGTIGIAAEVSRVDTWYARDTSIIDEGLKALQDRLNDAGQGAIDGIIWGANRFPMGDHPECLSPGIPQDRGCLGGLFISILLKGVTVTGGAIAGGVVGAIDRKTYSNPPLIELPERAVIQVVQESIDAVGLPKRLRDRVWERVQGNQTYHFELVPNVSAASQETREEPNRDKGARYWLLQDKEIQTLLKVRIPLIEFRGSDPEDSFRLVVHVETTLLRTHDQVCLRHRTWEFKAGSYRIDEWRENDAQRLVDELDRGLPLIAQRVTAAFFEQPSWFSFGASSPVTLQSESLACPG